VTIALAAAVGGLRAPVVNHHDAIKALTIVNGSTDGLWWPGYVKQ
jgi:hypothetical protein